MKTIKTLLVDDEPLALSHLEGILKKDCKELDIVGTACHIEEALEKILVLKPDLIFLDIELGGASGFDLLKKCPAKNFEVIFVTAHNHFGIEAVKNQALDYVLKPIVKLELLMAVETAVKIIASKSNNNSSEFLPKFISRISLPTMDGLIIIETENIIFLESERRYTRFHMADGVKHLVSRNLGEYEEELEKKGFARIHNSYIVNLAYVARYIKGRGGYVVLKNGQSLEVSHRKKDDFLDKLD